jgi:peptidoglycan/LPS O-acetylase OafA/YrhL
MDEEEFTLDILLKMHMMWGVMVLLFLLSIFLPKQKISPVLLRISYLVMLGSGIGMLFYIHFPLFYMIKGLLAILLIGVMEMLLGRTKRREPVLPFWILFILLIILVPAMGYGYIHF